MTSGSAGVLSEASGASGTMSGASGATSGASGAMRGAAGANTKLILISQSTRLIPILRFNLRKDFSLPIKFIATHNSVEIL